MRDTSSTIAAVPAADPTPVVHVAIASYLAEHHLGCNSIYIPRLAGASFEVWIRDVDVERWITAGVDLTDQHVRDFTPDPGKVVVTAKADLPTALGTVTVRLSWMETKTLSRRLQVVQP